MTMLRALPALLCLSYAAAAAAQTAGGHRGGSLEDARAHLRAGERFYDEARYEQAAREMEAAYAIRAAPDLQYNLAQCYERLGRPADAMRAYTRYLEGKPEAEDREVVRMRIANLEERLRAGADTVPTPPPERVVLKTVVVYRDAPPPPGRGARFAAYGLGGLALAALGGGIAFSVLAAQSADRVTGGGSLETPVVWGGQVAEADSAGRTYAVVGAVSFGVAGAAAAGALGLHLLGQKIDREAPKVTLAPWLGAGGGGVAAAGLF